MNVFQKLLLFQCIFAATKKTDAMGMGPFDYTVLGVEGCPGIVNKKMEISVKILKVVRKAITIDANMSLTVPFNDDVTLTMRFAQFTNGGWKDNFFVKDFKSACTTLFTMVPDLIEKLRIAANVSKSIVKCPFPKGFYSVKAFLIDFDLSGIPVFMYNKYRGDIGFTKKEEQIGCVRFYADVYPKKKKKKNGK